MIIDAYSGEKQLCMRILEENPCTSVQPRLEVSINCLCSALSYKPLTAQQTSPASIGHTGFLRAAQLTLGVFSFTLPDTCGCLSTPHAATLNAMLRGLAAVCISCVWNSQLLPA